jgi:hypothetical protein
MATRASGYSPWNTESDDNCCKNRLITRWRGCGCYGCFRQPSTATDVGVHSRRLRNVALPAADPGDVPSSLPRSLSLVVPPRTRKLQLA